MCCSHCRRGSVAAVTGTLLGREAITSCLADAHAAGSAALSEGCSFGAACPRSVPPQRRHVTKPQTTMANAATVAAATNRDHEQEHHNAKEGGQVKAVVKFL